MITPWVGCLPVSARAGHRRPDGQVQIETTVHVQLKLAVRIHMVHNSGESARRSASVSLSAHFGPARTACISSVLMYTSADWSRAGAARASEPVPPGVLFPPRRRSRSSQVPVPHVPVTEDEVDAAVGLAETLSGGDLLAAGFLGKPRRSA